MATPTSSSPATKPPPAAAHGHVPSHSRSVSQQQPPPQASTPGSVGGGGIGNLQGLSPAATRSVGVQSPAAAVAAYLNKRSPATTGTGHHGGGPGPSSGAIGGGRGRGSNNLNATPTSTGPPTSGAGGAQMMSGTGSQAMLNFDSPSAAAALGGLNLHIPGLFDGSGTGATPLMAPSRSGIGLPSRAGDEGDDDERRRRRIETICSMLRSRPGRVSQESLERLAKRVGLECLWEEGGDGTRTLSIAGTGVLIDVEFKKEAVVRVSLSFPTSPDPLSALAPQAAEVLHRELSPPGRNPFSLNTSLGPFADQLERLALLDKLSSPPGFNCFEAIAGIHASLEKIHEAEVSKIRGDGERTEEDSANAELEAFCKHSGRPQMHARGKLGPSLEYWAERRHGTTRKRTASGEVKESSNPAKEGPETTGKIWTTIIECENSPAELYPPARVSNAWVSSRVLCGDDSILQDQIDWLEPDPSVISDRARSGDQGGGGDTNMMNSGANGANAGGTAGSGGKAPNVRFVARLEPPMVLPLVVAYEIYNAVNAALSQDFSPGHFDRLLLREMGRKPSSASTKPPKFAIHTDDGPDLTWTRHVSSKDHKDASDVSHRYITNGGKQDFGRIIDEIPFSHPRQLVALLPVLRQYAALSSLIQHSIGDAKVENGISVSPNYREADLSSWLGEDTDSSPALPIDISISAQPIPRVSVVFPTDDSERSSSTSFTIEVGSNGTMKIVDYLNLLPLDAGESKSFTIKDLQNVIEDSEDISIAVELVRKIWRGVEITENLV